MKKILVLGGTGMAGHTIALYFKSRGYDVTSFARRPLSFANNILGDAMSCGKEQLTDILSRDFDVVINCIGVLVKESEMRPERAAYLNGYFPHLIASILKDKKTKLIHMSTDCVYSGKNGPYRETSCKDAEDFYGRSKALGEIDDNKNLTFRNSIIGPDINKEGVGLLNWFMKQEGKIKGYAKSYWSGVTTLTLAKAMERAIEEDLTGIYNLVNNKRISKLGLLELFNDYMRHGKLEIEPYYSEETELNKAMINSREDFPFVVPSYEEMVMEMATWIIKHIDLYPHYRDAMGLNSYII